MPGKVRRFGHCLKCGSAMHVRKVRPKGEFVIIRYRRCPQCGHRERTIEKRQPYLSDCRSGQPCIGRRQA